MRCRGIFIPSIKVHDVCCQSFKLFTFHAKCYKISRNPYEVLGLKNTCSTQDVKKAYIKLCKEFHPDMKPGDASQHKKFVELNNAYTTLINAESRQKAEDKSYNTNDYSQRDHRESSNPFHQGRWKEHKPWYEREDYQQYYQSRAPLKPVKHVWVVVGCFLLIIVGSLLYYSAYRYATDYTLKKVDARSKLISENYQNARNSALEIGKEERIKKLKRKWNM